MDIPRFARTRRHRVVVEQRGSDRVTTMGMKELAFWALIAVSSVCAGIYGYHRFKLIRPDLFDEGKTHGVSEAERAARIAEYQQKGDTLSRAAAVTRAPKPGETCIDGVIVTTTGNGAGSETRTVVANGQSVRCDAQTGQH
ncbi:MAG TPA: hypothetical protein VGO25_12050 [Rhodanobacteraceae bacterium]|nr:hypothetical protein [Rhodanobacteraceae bacterium]